MHQKFNGLETELGGFVFLDLDQNGSTGGDSGFFSVPDEGQTGHEYLISLFGANVSDEVLLIERCGGRAEFIPVRKINESSIEIEIPLSLVTDDGNMNFWVVVGNLEGPTDVLFDNRPFELFVASAEIFPDAAKILEGTRFDFAYRLRSDVTQFGSAVFLNGQLFASSHADQRVIISDFTDFLDLGESNEVVVALFTERGMFLAKNVYNFVPQIE